VDEELGLLVVSATGAVEACSAGALRRVFDVADAAGHLRVLVDLTRLDDVDPALALILLEQDERLAASGGWLWIVHGTAELAAALRWSGVSTRVRTSPQALARTAEQVEASC
jgi:anti-anti-sigma regulatory factor